jgi:hypothetical protein
MAESIRDKWQSSLEVIRVASELQLAVIDKAKCWNNFYTIQPDAKFLFRSTTSLRMDIINLTVNNTLVDAATSINTPLDPFAVIHCMPDLQTLELCIQKSVKRVAHFSPSLPNLRILLVEFEHVIKFGPTAFDHLTGLEKFTIRGNDEKVASKFETGLAPLLFECSWIKLLKLNSADVGNIEEIRSTCSVVSMFPLSGLEALDFTPDVNSDMSILFRQCANLEDLTICLSNLSQVAQGQLSCLSELKYLTLYRFGTVTEGIYFNNYK